ncbi:pentapeptide repeat-containing protein [Allorhizocola rhizosphaerae]|uniref:pentapeptide repeat-containing protein n=1 Tax=Allorhizocola rhizosphaerae TaxID=1872709 RepID=UPI0013C2C646|nr:pentapeptide repeat-containing protein [Allorhizocola rhizosphaerae]
MILKTGRTARWRVLAASVIGVAAATILLVYFPTWAYPNLAGPDFALITDVQRRIELQQAQGQLQNSLRTMLLQALAGIVIIMGAIATWRQVHISRDVHVTQQFSHAVDQIGDDKLDVRIGGLYALERIARTTPDERVTIMFMLGAFIRHRSPWPDTTAGSPEPHPTETVDRKVPWLRVRKPDVQAAMNVLSRRLVDPNAARLYLARTDLRSLQVNDGSQFTNSNFNHANLARAWLRGAVLDRSGFKNCDLRLANLNQASLVGADLRHAHLQQADLSGADLSNADLRGANLTDTNLTGANLTGIRTDDSIIWPHDHDLTS